MENDSEVKISKEALSELFKIAGEEVPDEITEDTIHNLKSKIENLKSSPQQTSDIGADSLDFSNGVQNAAQKNILVVDDIGVVTYQLKILLQDLGYNVVVAKDIFKAINSFVHSSYAFIIMDLFVSTEQEGYTLLNEVKKLITQNNLSTKVIVITASNKAENRLRCMNGGADYFVKKDVGWQDKIIELIEGKKVTPKAPNGENQESQDVPEAQ